MAKFFSLQKPKWPYKILLNLSFIFIISSLFISHLHSSNNKIIWADSNPLPTYYNKLMESGIGCKGIQNSQNKQEKCLYVKSHQGCKPRGYIPYLQLFYCSLSPILGYFSLAIWVILLFYLLADTSSNYFCYSLSGLSKNLKISPTIAGVSLLSLGNGAPDVFASLISFTDNSTTDIGLNSILGGAFFVSCVVVGIISIFVSTKISRISFITNVVFLVLSNLCILIINIVAKINLWGALFYLSLYLVYVFFIFTFETCCDEDTTINLHLKEIQDGLADVEAPLIGPKSIDQVEPQTYHHAGKVTIFVNKFLFILEMPLELPRKVTIPIVSEEKWSKPFAVCSVTLAPIALSLILNFNSTKSTNLIFGVSGAIGIAFGIIAFCTTEKINPPRKCLLIWLLGGFIMSITWTDILAQELISLLVAIGLILGINHSILGLTVLAWGNSVGDLVANVTMAKKCGPQGAQLAISGCYAGPIFNTLVGLGLSLTFSAWTSYPASFAISVDHSIFITIGFFMVALLWALVTLPKRMMMPDKCLGSGLLVIYLGFLSLQIARSLGLVVNS